jgi:hypothetical protein
MTPMCYRYNYRHRNRVKGETAPPAQLITVFQLCVRNTKILISYAVQFSQFRRRTIISKIFTFILKGNVHLRKGKMVLLAHRQGVIASGVYSYATQIELTEIKNYVRNISSSNTVQ